MNLILGFVLIIATMSGIGTYARSAEIQEISQCVPSSFTKDVPCSATDLTGPAKLAGLQAGDVITAVNRTTVTTWDQVNDFAIKNPGLLNLTVKRGGNTVDVTISPAMVTRPVVDAAGNPSNQTVPFFGVVLKPVRVPQSIATSLQYSGSMLGSTFEMIATLPVQVYKMISGTISGEKRDGNGPISVIGIGQVAGEVASNQQASWLDKLSTGLMMLASLNFALFAFNMIPLLPLDGGHIAGGLYEAIKRGLWRITGRKDPGPADTAQLMPITYLVTYALIALSLVLIVVDLINPIVLK